MHKMKSLLVVTLVLLMLVTSVQGELFKDEIVYAKLSATGAVQGVYIVNAFETDEPSEIVDYGTYDRVTNLSDTQPLSYTDGAVSCQVEPGRFFYQGDAPAKDLPWLIDISYQLDGKAIEPDRLSGATGELEILLNIKVNESMADLAATSALQITVSFNSANTRAIEAEKATIAWAGGNQTLAYVLLPGAGASYVIKAKVTDFFMPGMQFAGVRMAMDADMYKQAALKQLEGTAFAATAGNMLDNFIKGIQNTPIRSFTDERNESIRSVQYVMITEEIAPKADEEPAAAMPDEQQQETIWTRFLALFKG